jgi:hypothetical protein
LREPACNGVGTGEHGLRLGRLALRDLGRKELRMVNAHPEGDSPVLPVLDALNVRPELAGEIGRADLLDQSPVRVNLRRHTRMVHPLCTESTCG